MLTSGYLYLFDLIKIHHFAYLNTIFARGGGVQARLPENSSDNVFCPTFFHSFTVVFINGIFQNYDFPRFQRGSGGPTFPWGSQMLFSIETNRT